MYLSERLVSSDGVREGVCIIGGACVPVRAPRRLCLVDVSTADAV